MWSMVEKEIHATNLRILLGKVHDVADLLRFDQRVASKALETHERAVRMHRVDRALEDLIELRGVIRRRARAPAARSRSLGLQVVWVEVRP